jgi:hypothetical protein
MKKTIGIILVIVGIGLGAYGFSQMGDDSASIEIGDLELSAKDQEASNQTLIIFALSGLAIIGGAVMASRK